jgi:hypothetical protein
VAAEDQYGRWGPDGSGRRMGAGAIAIAAAIGALVGTIA